MRALVTGAGGFVGPYLVPALREGGHEVLAAGGMHDIGTDLVPIDLADAASLNAAFDLAAPDVVFHLAAQAFVPRALEAPEQTYETNIMGTSRMLAALRAWRERSGSDARFVFVSSADVYGRQGGAAPLDENARPDPENPYAASKAAGEAIVLGEARSFGVDAVIARAFNHIGPGQNERFVVPSFAAQLARIAAGAPAVLHCGNLAARRDFLDVRDVVRAYVALAERGERGQAYNVCSGVATAIRDLLGELIRIAHVPVEVREDAARMRPSDTALLYGSNEKLRRATGWEPKIPLSRSLQDIYRAAQMSGAS